MSFTPAIADLCSPERVVARVSFPKADRSQPTMLEKRGAFGDVLESWAGLYLDLGDVDWYDLQMRCLMPSLRTGYSLATAGHAHAPRPLLTGIGLSGRHIGRI